MTARLSRRAVCGAALAALVGGALALPALAAKDDLDLVTRATGVAGAPAVASSFEATLSADGRLVAFQSGADNLSTEDDNDFTNVFVRDLQANTTTLVSRASGATGAAGDAVSAGAEISADGRFVAFHSAADNLSTEDDDDFIDVFVRDLQAGTTTLVSRATGPAGVAGDDDSTQATISADGRLVAFESQADNLSGDDVNIVTDVFVRDLLTGTTTLVSRESGPGGAGGLSASLQPTISADGRVVAFHSDADNLSAEDDAAALDVFVRDLPASTTTLVSRADGPTGAGGGDGSSGASISADGRRIAFSSFADNLSTEDDNDLTNVFVRDRLAGTTALASRAAGPAGAGADGDSGTGAKAFSADGRLLAFASIANNLSAEDVDAVSDVFVRDLQAQIVTLVSRAAGPAGAAGSDGSGDAAISADGRFVAFQSLADNLAADDDNAVVNIFRRDVLGPPPPPAAPRPPAAAPRAAAAGARCAGLRATIVGTGRRDVLRGTARRDVIAALGGNDVVRGLGGADLICLGAGTDRGIGGAGADRVLGQLGADRLEGGLGRDRLEGGPGRDLLLGGAGIDRLLGLGGRDTARGGPGADVCRVETRAAC